MTTAREGSARCDRCERMTTTVRVVRWEVDTLDDEHVALQWSMCRKCRGEVLDLVRTAVSAVRAW